MGEKGNGPQLLAPEGPRLLRGGVGGAPAHGAGLPRTVRAWPFRASVGSGVSGGVRCPGSASDVTVGQSWALEPQFPHL